MNIVPSNNQPLDPNAQQRARELLEDWWKDKSPETQKSYKYSIKVFEEFLQTLDTRMTVQGLVGLTLGEANHVVLKFKNWLKEKDCKPATVNSRMAAVKSYYQMLNGAGLCAWVIGTKGEKSRTYKDTRGPGSDKFQQMLDYARNQDDKRLAARDYALLRLLGSQAFRRNGAASLDVEHIDFENKCAWILLKGSRVERTRFSINDETLDSISAWIGIRGKQAGPLFPGRNGKGRIAGNSVWAMVKRISHALGFDTRPHGLRHLGCSEAAEAAHGDLRAVMAYSGHKNLSTIQLYIDNVADKGGEIAAKVGKNHG